MAWTVEVKDRAAKMIVRLDKPSRDRLTAFLTQLESLDNPRVPRAKP